MKNKWILKYTDEKVGINHYYWACSACEKSMLMGNHMPTLSHCPDCGFKLELGTDMLHYEVIQVLTQKVKENIELYKAGSSKGYDVSDYKAGAEFYIKEIRTLFKEAYKEMLSHGKGD